MSKKVLILKGSPRAKGNTSVLADAFAKGAIETGNEVKEYLLKDMLIYDCVGCRACQNNGGNCVRKDDMQKIYEDIKESDVIVFASPVYFYTWNGITKRVIDRSFAVESVLQNKTFYLLSAGAAPQETYMKTMINSYQQYVGCFRAGGNTAGGYVFALGTNGPRDAVNSEYEKKAYEMGKMI